MRTIWKYQLSVSPEEQYFEIPGWGGVCFVANQDGLANMVTIWCHVDPDKDLYTARFRVTGTGKHSPDSEFLYAGSAICGSYVWHVWRNSVTQRVK